MKVELDEYEIWQLKYLVKDKMEELDKSSKSKLWSEETRRIDKENYQMFADILEKFKQVS